MQRATRVVSLAERGNRPVADTVILDYAQRSAQAVTATGLKGGRFEIALAQAARLRTDDALLLEDGSLVEVVAAPEPLIEARADDVAGLARLAWHLGDRHIPVQMLPNRIRARREPGIENLLTSLGAKLDADRSAVRAGRRRLRVHIAHDHDHDHAHGHHHHHDH